MSKVSYNQETKSFSIEEDKNFALPGYGTSAGVGSVIGGGMNIYKRNQYEKELIKGGMDPIEAKEKAKKRYGGVAKGAMTGAKYGLGARFAGGRIRNLGKSIIPARKR